MKKEIRKMAKNLVNYSCRVKPGEKVMLELGGVDNDMELALVEEVYKAGAFPFVVPRQNSRISKMHYRYQTEDYLNLKAKYMSFQMSDMDAYIGIRGASNVFEMSDIPSAKIKQANKLYFHPVHSEIRVPKTKWVITQWPTSSFAQLAGMSTDEFRKFYFKVCNLDYSRMDKAMDAMVALMHKTDKVRIVAKDTDISFSIKDIPAIKCAGQFNIPDGEIYTAPVKDSVNGKITYNIPTLQNGIRFDNVSLEFENGRIVKASCPNHKKELQKILNSDEGSKYIGEFAIGVNPYVTKPMLDILFDEKMCGSIHFTPGQCYDEAWNGNKSIVHWDMVQSHLKQYGGGEIWFDGKLIRKNGVFVVPELLALNPENLK